MTPCAPTGRGPARQPATRSCGPWLKRDWAKPRCVPSPGALQLPSADKPAAPCLASRIPHFQEVSEEKLAQIERAEKALRTLGFAESRVRHHGEVARIELPVGDLVRAVSSPTREEIHAALMAAGFRFAAVDVLGIQSGAFTLSLLGSRD